MLFIKENIMSGFDVILVPGGGVRRGGELPPWVKRRLDLAGQLSLNEPIVALSAGTVHRPPPLDDKGFPIFEATAASDYLITQGIEPNRILTETCSYDTIGNAYFSRVIHVDPAQFKKICIITSDFHLPRTEAIFRWIYGMDDPENSYQLTFKSVPDTGIPDKVLRARIEREKASLNQFIETRNRILTLKQLHDWLYTEHAAYAAGSQPDRQTGEVINTY
jgi:uncharacterized SAM-binding protein YcdF (DUF218 family)